MRKIFFSLCVAAMSTTAFSAGIPLDNFDSYANQTALEAAWTVDSANLTLKTTGGAHSGSNFIQTGTASPVGRISKAISLTPTDEFPVVVDFWIRVPTTAQGRSYIQLEAPGTQLINFGVFNDPAGAGWFARTLGGGAPGTWGSVGSVNRVANTWTNLKIVVKKRDVTYFANGTELATQSRTASDWPELTVFRIGYTSSSAITVDYDDVQVYQAPSSVADWSMY